MKTTTLTLTDLQKLSRTGSRLKGKYEVTALGMVMGRYATLNVALDMARKLQAQTDARVEIR
jgi:hypothetical protein